MRGLRGLVVPAQAGVRAGAGAQPLVGAGWMLLTTFLFVSVTVVVRHLDGRVPAAEAAFLRFAIGLVFVLPMLGRLRAARLGARGLGLFALRGVVHALGVIAWFFAMARLPVAEVTAMNHLSPVYVTLGAVFLGERLRWPRLLAIAVAFAGVLLILRPGFREVAPAHLAMLGATMMLGLSYLLAKRMADRLDPGIVVAMLSVFVTLALAPFAAAVWVAPDAATLGWLAGVACLATAGHYTMTRAFRAAPLSVTQPVTYLQLVWATALGYWLFGEAVDGWVIAGGLTILGSVSAITWREARLKRGAMPAG